MNIGLYEKECEDVSRSTHAEAVALIVIKGDRGTAVDFTGPEFMLFRVPQLLRLVANDIEKLQKGTTTV